MVSDSMHVFDPCATGPDVPEMEIAATVRTCEESGEAVQERRTFSAVPHAYWWTGMDGRGC